MAALQAHSIAAVLWRGADFETIAEHMQATVSSDRMPFMLSLGGGVHHPTQTLSEAMLFMQEYQCDSLAALREATCDTPPTIMFMGHTAHKRADVALIRFILHHLPSWRVRVVIPDERYTPQLNVPAEVDYKLIVEPELANDVTVARLTAGARFVYISNPAVTNNFVENSTDTRVHPYHLSTFVVEQNNLVVLAPLPASDEIDSDIFHHPQSRIVRQMQNKIAIISSLVVHGLMAQGK